MNTFLELAGGVAGIALLYYGADYLIKGCVGVARKLHIPELVIGLTLVAFGTSAPEFVVSLNAVFVGKGDIAVGNIVGSNICNIALILGLCALIKPLAVNPRLFKMDLPIMLISTLLLAGFLYFSNGVNRWQSFVFLLMMAAFVGWQCRSALKNREEAEALTAELEENSGSREYHAVILLLFIPGGLIGLVAGAHLFVGGAVCAARLFNVPEAIIGLSIVAFGTSLPELATSLVASFKGEGDIAIGNVVGSNIFNILFILGIAPLIRPFEAPGIQTHDLLMISAVTLLVIPFMRTKYQVSRIEGGILFAGYIAYIAFLAAL